MANCIYHPDTAAAAYCRTCGNALCENCKRDVRGVIYCEPCIAARLQGTAPDIGASSGAGMPPPIPSIPPNVNVDSLPNPGLATFLGFIPGVGAMYNGQFKKALAHIVVFVTLTAAADTADFFGLFVFAFIVYMVMDARATAKARLHSAPLPDLIGIGALVSEELNAPGMRAATSNAMQAAGSLSQTRTQPPVAAFILIGLGCLFLLNNFDVFRFRIGHMLFPIGLIAWGVFAGYRRLSCAACPCARCKAARLTLPTLMISVGIIWLLNVMHVGHTLWPILFIVFGGLRLVQSSASTEGHIGPGAPGDSRCDMAPPPPPPATPAANNTVTQEVNRG